MVLIFKVFIIVAGVKLMLTSLTRHVKKEKISLTLEIKFSILLVSTKQQPFLNFTDVSGKLL